MPKEIQDLIDRIVDSTGPYLPQVAGALAILVVGWVVAWLVSRAVRFGIGKTGLNRLMNGWLRRGSGAPELHIDRWIGNAIYYLLLLLVIVGAIHVLEVTVINEPLVDFLVSIFDYIPQIIGAAILVLLAWLLATVLKFMVGQALGAIGLDERVTGQIRDGDAAAQRPIPLAQSLSEVVYWLVFLFFLPAILGVLELEGLLSPVRNLLDEILTYLPNILGAGLILVIGWFVARIVRRLVMNLLVSAGVDQLSERVGLAGILGEMRLSGLAGLVVYALIFVPVVLGALNALALEALTGPTSDMLNTILQAIPAILAGAIVLLLAYVVGRVAAELVSNFLAGVGFNGLPARIGLGTGALVEGRSASQIVGYLVVAAFMVVAVMATANLLGFDLFAELVSRFLVFATQIIFGLVIFVAGVLLSSLAARVIQASNVSLAGLWAMSARIAILFLAGAIALRAMGFANEIIILAFALPLASVSVGAAIAFGVGGREIAARELDNLIEAIRSRRTQG